MRQQIENQHEHDELCECGSSSVISDQVGVGHSVMIQAIKSRTICPYSEDGVYFASGVTEITSITARSIVSISKDVILISFFTRIIAVPLV